MNWLKVLVLVLAALHAAFGLYGLYAPLQMAQIAELQAPTAAARGEIRAIYGGLFLALGFALARGALGGPIGVAWIRAVGVAYAGLFLGRVVSVSVDGPAGYTLFAGAFEIGLAGFFVWAASQLRPGRQERAAGETPPLADGSVRSVPVQDPDSPGD